MKNITTFFLALFILSTVSFAQNPQTPQNVPPCEADPGFNQFDFWIGDWDVYANGNLAGTNKVEKILGNCVLMENWTGGGGSNGKSFNTYNSATKRWTQTWVDNAGGRYVFEGELVKGNMMLAGERTTGGNTTMFTLDFHPNNRKGSVRQVWKSSKDNGETWTVIFDGLYVKKGSKPPTK